MSKLRKWNAVFMGFATMALTISLILMAAATVATGYGYVVLAVRIGAVGAIAFGMGVYTQLRYLAARDAWLERRMNASSQASSQPSSRISVGSWLERRAID